jgi:hypothetical protein
MPTQTCIYCSAKAARWCDFVLGFEDKRGDGLFSLKEGDKLERCDAPLCEGHARHLGHIHFSGRWPVGGTESIDHCVGHTGSDHWRPLRAGEAEQLRYRHRCQAAGGLQLVPRR